MTQIRFTGIPTEHAHDLQNGGVDANGHKAELTISKGSSNPCRHCLKMVEEGEEMLVFALRPFKSVQPYAEQGPAFLHAEECAPYEENGSGLPPVLHDSRNYIVRGYGLDERIVYGTGKVTEQEDIMGRANELLENPDIEFVHVRSSSNNCWQARVERENNST